MPKEWPKNYFSLICTTQRKNSNYTVFNELSNKYLSLIQNQPGFLGIEIVREDNGLGIEISYWKDIVDIKNWRHVEDKQIYNKYKRENIFVWYQIRVSQVHSEFEFGLDNL